MNAHVKPRAKHAARTALRPLRRVRRPAEQPVLEEDVEVLLDEGLDLLDGIAFGAEKNG